VGDKAIETIYLSSDNLSLVLAQIQGKSKPRVASLPIGYTISKEDIVRDVEGICKLDDTFLLPIEMAYDAFREFLEKPLAMLAWCHILKGQRLMKNFLPGPAVRENLTVYIRTSPFEEGVHSFQCVCTIGRTHPGLLEREYNSSMIWEPEDVSIQFKKRLVSYRYQKIFVDGEYIFRIRLNRSS